MRSGGRKRGREAGESASCSLHDENQHCENTDGLSAGKHRPLGDSRLPFLFSSSLPLFPLAFFLFQNRPAM
jgi:hypothetical protein